MSSSAYTANLVSGASVGNLALGTPTGNLGSGYSIGNLGSRFSTSNLGSLPSTGNLGSGLLTDNLPSGGSTVNLRWYTGGALTASLAFRATNRNLTSAASTGGLTSNYDYNFGQIINIISAFIRKSWLFNVKFFINKSVLKCRFIIYN